jgi:hypothetical protein
VQLVRLAPNAELLELEASWIVPPVLFGCVIPPAAHGALERDHRPIGLSFFRHDDGPRFLFSRDSFLFPH